MQRAIDGEGRIGQAARYHLSARGKRFRSRLALEAGRAIDAPAAPVHSLAAACELIHEASLVHDDVQDQDDRRRGQATVWSRFGVEIAISVGDLMINQSFRLLLDAPLDANRRCELAGLLSDAVRRTVFGQSREEVRARDAELTEAEYYEIAEAKTGHLLALPIEGALRIVGADPTACRATRDAMLAVGTAYQVQDDLLDLLGQKTRSRPGADLRSGKATYPLIVFRDSIDSQRRREFVEFLGSAEARSDAGLAERWRRSVVASDAVAISQRTIASLCHRGETSCDALPRPLRELMVCAIRELTRGSRSGSSSRGSE